MAGLPEQEPECREGTQEARWIRRPLNRDRELMPRLARGDAAALDHVKRTSQTGASGRLPRASETRSKQPRAKEWEGVT
jgi:hypothetical protein